MVVDDNTVMLDFLNTLLEMEGHTPIIISRPEDFLPTTETERPDIILLDMHLAEQDTLTILQSLKHDPDLSEIPVIALSGMDLKDKCLASGADDFMLKPFLPSQLFAKVNQLLQSRALAVATAEGPHSPATPPLTPRSSDQPKVISPILEQETHDS